MNGDYTGDIALQANIPTQAETLLHSLEWAAAGIGLHANAHKMEYMSFNQTGDISTLNGSSETSWQVHLPRKQCLIKWGRHQHVTSKSMDSYQEAIGHMEVRPDRLKEKQFFPSSDHVDTTVWMHYMDANQMYEEKAWQQLHKNATSNIEQVLEAAPSKQQLYGHLPPITKTI